MRFGRKELTIEQIYGELARYPQVEKAIIYGSRAIEDDKQALISTWLWWGVRI